MEIRISASTLGPGPGSIPIGSWYVCHVSLSELIRGDSIIIMVSTTYGCIKLTNMCQARYPVGLYCFSASHSCPCL